MMARTSVCGRVSFCGALDFSAPFLFEDPSLHIKHELVTLFLIFLISNSPNIHLGGLIYQR